MFLQVSVILSMGGGGMRGCGVWMVAGGIRGCWGACMVAGVCVVGGMHGCQGVHGCWGGMRGSWGACVVAGGMCGWQGHAWSLGGWGGMHRIRRDTVNERAVRILLECILGTTTKRSCRIQSCPTCNSRYFLASYNKYRSARLFVVGLCYLMITGMEEWNWRPFKK